MKLNVYVAASGGAARRICWYEGTSDAQVEKAIRMQLRLPRDVQFLLSDVDGDVVPVSSTMPNGQHYTLALHEEDEEVEVGTSVDVSPDMNTLVTSEVTSPLITPRPVTPASKRRRLEAGSTSSTASPVTEAEEAGTPPTMAITVVRHPSSPPQRFATVIAQFVDTFTRPIANDDNVNFIPNAGRFALYSLYSELVRDTRFHPKREDVFYKMTSMHGKVDRQRVNRYYRCPAQSGEGDEFVQCKPQGKGVLLRRYRKVESFEELEDVVKSAPFVAWLQLDPTDVVALYVRFVDGFTPIPKSGYLAQDKTSDAIVQNDAFIA
ncbi:hypothetical protein PRIC1_004658 [Phytophthora ramorum]